MKLICDCPRYWFSQGRISRASKISRAIKSRLSQHCRAAVPCQEQINATLELAPFRYLFSSLKPSGGKLCL
jgi:hypothetical protein